MSESSDIPIVFLTAKTDIESITEGFRIGGVDYITKPFNREELLARVKTHLNIQKQRSELRALNATKDKFFSIIAHDLKSPFNQLLGLSELIESYAAKSNDVEIKKMAGLINESAKNGKDLLENLLDWSRTQTGTLSFQLKEIELSALTIEMINMVRHFAVQKSISMDSHVPEGTIVEADENMLKTILRNLLTNAIKFTRNGGRIQVCSKSENNHVRITVEDNGIGIKKDVIPKLFLIEQNPTTKGTREEKGSGLGLILCKEFVDLHNGKIWAESEAGKGSRFHIALPIIES